MTNTDDKSDNNIEKAKKRKKKFKIKRIFRKRTLARLAAIQIYYQYQFRNAELSLLEIQNDLFSNFALSFKDDFAEQKDIVEKIDNNHLNQILAIANQGFDEADADIEKYLTEGRKLSEIELLMLIIIRFYISEIKFLNDVPFKVAIDEYLDIAASFFENKKITFLNAIFENIAKQYRSQEYQKVKEQKKLNEKN